MSMLRSHTVPLYGIHNDKFSSSHMLILQVCLLTLTVLGIKLAATKYPEVP